MQSPRRNVYTRKRVWVSVWKFGCQGRFLLDPGSTDSAVAPYMVSKWGIRLQKFPTPQVYLTADEGEMLSTSFFERLVVSSGPATFFVNGIVLETPKWDGVLGMDSLYGTRAVTDWGMGSVYLRGRMLD